MRTYHKDSVKLKYIYFQSADIDECARDTDNCDVNADCVNTGGSFQCDCKTGFEGSGRVCTGIYVLCICLCVHVGHAS